MRYLFLFILSSILCVSCGETTPQAASLFVDVDGALYTSNVVPFDVHRSYVVEIKIPQNLSNDNELLLNAGQLFDSMQVIRLSSQVDALIGDIDKLIELDDRFIISDVVKAKSVKAFDLAGNYICSYGRQGRGPGEYTEPTTVAVFDNMVKIYDQYQGKLVFFDLNGRYIKDVRVPFIFHEFAQVDSNRYYFHCFMEDNVHLAEILDYMLIETDSNFVVSQKGLYRQYGTYGRFGRKNMRYGSMGNFISIPHIDTVYQVAENQTLDARYFIDYGGRKLSDELLLHENFREALDAINNDPQFIVPSDRMFDLSEFFIFQFTIKARLYTGFFDKESRKLVVYNMVHDGATICFGSSNYVCGDDNYLIGVVEPTYIFDKYARFIEDVKNPAIDKSELDKFLRQYEVPLASAKEVLETDNLVLVRYYLSKIDE